MIRITLNVFLCYASLLAQTAVQFNSIPLYYEEITKIVDSLVELKPNLVTKKVYGTSDQGRDCFAVRISNPAIPDEIKPEVGFDAGTHADEWVAMYLCNQLMRDLVRDYDSDNEIKALVDSTEIWFYPKVFMDGNSRLNDDDININRDWTFTVGTTLSSQHTIFAARWIHENRFVYHWTGHDGVETIGWFSNSQDATHYKDLAQRYYAFASYLALSGGYASNGWTNSAVHGITGALSYLVEVHGAHAPARIDSIGPMRYGQHKPAMLDMIKRAGYGIRGVVTDSASGEPVSAQVWIDDVAGAKTLRHIFTKPEVGDFHKYVIPGSYKVKVTANGYLPSQKIDVIVPESGAVNMDFRLVKSESAGHFGHMTMIRVNTLTFQNERSNYFKTQNHLGAPDGEGYRQGKRGYVVIDMGRACHVLPNKADLKVYDMDSETSPKRYSVEVAMDFTGNWVSVGTDSGTKSFDLSPLQVDSFRYVKVTDGGNGDSATLTTSFGLDAIEALNPSKDASTNREICSISKCIAPKAALFATPNPFNPVVSLNIQVSEDNLLSLAVYDAGGRLTKRLAEGFYKSGSYKFTWDGVKSDGCAAPSGIYLFRLQTHRGIITSKSLLSR